MSQGFCNHCLSVKPGGTKGSRWSLSLCTLVLAVIFEASDRRVGGLLDDFRRLVDRLCLLDGSHQFVAKVIMS